MSRRMKGRHFKAHAQPDAEPAAPLELDDSNSTLDPWSGIRTAHQLNTRAYVVAGHDELDEEPIPDGFVEL